ncbi:ADP-ribose pyrophosphatase YjhB (NUDIX family) [Nocardioides zeae]|uniref:ADP-ribose pyrophosphatase YjhB (NUDIX family) n=2 Tax=Nocardioides zeae TaxID=1457234 RepID=A0ACC6IKV6_9ACTN|nr:NUDIX hydrolase family protein [Nocardioides zeae]MDQ1105008.1 ADP-ribose pyrophosphatase YjhB (NUDIX family) [Nocardioides zeae]MDR6175278.1 ADP-ribose pyrophosphatase YjhB (NUDIX family) [Nocardioides zeae]MDR6211230.1 ADP-ribose pyrophosphatase YjhB (NUDIX family) [Nocardioides zeae]
MTLFGAHEPEREPTPEVFGVDAQASPGWLSQEGLAETRGRVPILYVEAVPVRVDHLGQVEKVGLLLRGSMDGRMSRSFVSGRVLLGETVRRALLRNLEKDLGPAAFPRIPASPVPFTVAEYLPLPGVTALHDPRQHAVSLVYVVSVTGDCQPRQDALELTWLTPAEALAPEVLADMEGGRGVLLTQALAHLNALG